ncbi:MAG: RagB/SusD family nutrient uptake outer membrane protein [Tannerellaceae bacterium]|nr:RagB/SusD family nutrient uptake outer membrane protein [Tannerellaceae bacterium]
MVGFLTGCVGLDVVPSNKFTEETYWTSEENTTSVLTMGYRQMFEAKRHFGNEILSDNIVSAYGSPDEKIIAMGAATPSLSRFEDEWKDCYGGIKTTHTFLGNIDKVEMNETKKERMKSEIRFIRAMLFFRLTTWWGDVPFFTEDITKEEAVEIKQTPHKDIIAWIHQELEDIAEILPTRAQYARADRGRITAGAAVALNARVALYENDWERVKKYCEQLITESTYGEYGLFDNYEELFWKVNQYNEEIILDIEYVTDYRTWSELQDYVPMSQEARLCVAAPTQQLIDCYITLNGEKPVNGEDYSNRDPRLAATVVYNGSSWTKRDGNTETIWTDPARDTKDRFQTGSAGTPTGYYYRKYADPSPAAYTAKWDCNVNIPTIRFADVLLMYAEAMHELGQMNKDIWDKTIRPIRERAKFTADTALDFPATASNEELREIIRNERRCELALEGLRIFDIRRWKIAENVLPEPPRGASFTTAYPARSFNRNRDYLWPIPRKEMLLNPNLVQNDGY